MPLDRSQIADKLSALETHFVVFERQKVIEQQVLADLDLRLAQLRSMNPSEVESYAIIAPSGSGKSRCMERLENRISEHLERSDCAEGRVLSLQLRANPNLKDLGANILSLIGMDFSPRSRSIDYIWGVVKHQLRENKVMYLMLDEAQHLNANHKLRDQGTVDQLKSLTQDKSWPVSLVLSGVEDLHDLVSRERQLLRRVSTFHFGSLDPGAHTDEVLGLAYSYCEKAGLDFHVEPHDYSNFAHRLMHASNYQRGETIKWILRAIATAFYEGSGALRQDQFAAAYRVKRTCADINNPFVAYAFSEIDTAHMAPEAYVL